MNAVTAVEVGVEKLRAPFPENQISKLPKESRKQIDERKSDNSKVVFNCAVCGGIHHKNAVHLDYVGHAAATDRLLDTDLEWTWEPLAVDPRGLPAFDENGGLWIKLTVCGITRLGYGSADGKSGGDAKKEIIGDAIRNAGMRFGMALDLWHKGDLHAEETDAGPESPTPTPTPKATDKPAHITDAQRSELIALAEAQGIEVREICKVGNIPGLNRMLATNFDAAKRWIAKQPARETNPQSSDVLEDDIPY